MKPTLTHLACCGALIAGGAVAVAAPGQQGTRTPGEPTQARTLIDNRGLDQAVPVSIENIGTRTAVPVQLTGPATVTFDPSTPVTVRVIRQQWEYLQLIVPGGQDPVAALNGAGAEGWETTSVQVAVRNGILIVLKRPR